MAYQPKSYRKFVATAATAAMVATSMGAIATPADAASNFKDVATSYQEAVAFLLSTGATQGINETEFGTYNNIKRADAAVMIAKVVGLDLASAPDAGFKDVPARAKAAVNALKEAGIINGKTETSFGSDDTLTRGEMAIIIKRAFDLEAEEGTVLPFKDVNKNYEEAVKALYSNEVTSGTSETAFGTNAQITRGDFAKFVYRAADSGVLEIVDVISLDDANRFLQINFSKSVSSLEASDIQIKHAKKGDRYGVKEVKLSSDHRSAQVELFAKEDAEFVLEENTNYTVTVNVDGSALVSNFYAAAFTEARVIDINTEDSEFTVVDDDKDVKKTIEVPSDVEFDYQGAIGEIVRVWYNDDNELVRYQIDSASAQYDAIEITDVDEIKLLTEDKKYDTSDEKYDPDYSDDNKFKFFLNGEKVDIADHVDEKFNFAKVGFDKSGDIEYVSAYNFKNFLVVDRVEGEEVVGIEGEGTGGSFDADKATIIKDGKVISLDELEKGDVLFFYENSDDKKQRFAEVYNNTLTGEIETVYHESVKVDGKTYDFKYDSADIEGFDFDYAGGAVYLNEDGETEFIDSDAAEELQAAGEVTLHLDRAGNLVYIGGDTAEVESNTKTAIFTENVIGYEQAREKVEMELLTEDDEEVLYDLDLEDLKTITVDGFEYDIENTNPDSDEYTIGFGSDETEVLIKDSEGNLKETIDLNQTLGMVVKLHLDDNNNIEELELFRGANTSKEGFDTLEATKVVEPGDDYFKATSGSKQLNSDTVVYDVTDGNDPDDISITTWGEYTGSDINDATVIYDEDNEVIALVIKHTTTNDKVYEEAVITNVLRNTDKEVVEITAFVNDEEVTYEVDEVDVSLDKGDVAVLVFDDNNEGLVEDIEVAGDSEFDSRVTSGSVDKVDVGKREVTIDGTVYKLVSDGVVLDGKDNSDISEESLSDLRGENYVTVVKDEKTGNFVKFFVMEEGPINNPNGPAAVTGLDFTDTDDTEGEIAGNVTFTASTSDDVDHYEILVGDQVVDTTTATHYEIANDTAYASKIKVVAVDEDGNKSSAATVNVTDVKANRTAEIADAAQETGFTTTSNVANQEVSVEAPADKQGEKVVDVVAALQDELENANLDLDSVVIDGQTFDSASVTDIGDALEALTGVAGASNITVADLAGHSFNVVVNGEEYTLTFPAE